MNKGMVTFIRNAQRISKLPCVPAPLPRLKALTGLTAFALRRQFEIAGWHAERVWTRSPSGRRLLTQWWCPPGNTAPRPPRGRPKTSITVRDIQQYLVQ
jgi:hypothetical protein